MATRGDLWLIATNAAGEVLDYKRWKEEAHLVLTAETSYEESIDYLFDNTPKKYHPKTYFDITKWKYRIGE